MKKHVIIKSLLMVVMLCVCSGASAQGFLKKLGKAANKAADVTSTVTSSTQTVANGLTTNADGTQTFAWDSIPVYHAAKIYQVDASCAKMKNADGTDIYKVLLVDQFGNKRSASAVKAQHQRINKQIGIVLKNIGVGAGMGAASQLLSGGGLKNAAVGAASGALTGALASLGNISNIKNERKSLKQQEKLLAAYEKNFTEEGDLKNAEVDPSKIDDLGLKEDNSLSMTAADVKKELADASFNDASNSVLDDFDAITNAATKK